MSFEVRIEVFEGPFDLLLQLIMRQEVDIHQVSVAQITESYLEYIEDIPEFDLDTATEFLMIAATLLLIKTRSLLPQPEDEFETLEDTENAREYLIGRLIEYRKFANAAEWLESMYEGQSLYIPRLRELEVDYAYLYPDPFEGVTVSALSQVIIELIGERFGEKVDTSYIAPIKVSVADQIDRVSGQIAAAKDITFGELIDDLSSKLEVIATFLAILELYKRGEVKLSQRRLFGEIKIERQEGEKSGVV